MRTPHLIRAVTMVLAIAVTTTPAISRAADPVTVIVNGQTVAFDQPPVERGGRVFVPLRGVFERLGASVVYDNGVINATGNGRTISLHIGSTAATVSAPNLATSSAVSAPGPHPTSRTRWPGRRPANAMS